MKYHFLVFVLAAAPVCADATQQQSLPPEAQAQIQELYRERNDARAAADYWQSAAIEARARLAQAQAQIARLQPEAKAPRK